MKTEFTGTSLDDLWLEHLDAPFPDGFRGRDLNGIDFVMLDADIAGCVQTFLECGDLNLFQTAILGLSYRDASYIVLTSNDIDSKYFRRLERLAELVLKAVGIKNETQDNQ